MVIWRIDTADSLPLFQQIVNTVKRAVATGRFRPGDRLPSVRELAGDLVVNPNTIAKAYQALESDGVTRSRRGAGTFIAERRVILKADERRRRFAKALDAALSDAVNLGLSAEEVAKSFATALKRFRFEGRKP